MESLIHKAESYTGDTYKKIVDLSRHIKCPDRLVEPLEELQRYETIMDYYLEKTIDGDNLKERVKVSDRLYSSKNMHYLSKVIDDARKVLYRFDDFVRWFSKDKFLKDRISAKADFLKKHIDPKYQYTSSYSKLLNILKNKK